MALINTLRKRMGKIVVGLVAFSMVAFILADFLQKGSSLFSDDNEIAEIAGTGITYPEFQKKVEELSYVFTVNQNRNPLSEDLDMIREQAWNALVLENAYYKQFEELGLTVTDAESVDMVQGNNIDPQIRQFFTNPNTGQFQRESVVNFLSSVKNDPQQRAAWLTFEKTLTPTRLITKYKSLFDKTNYVTKAEAKEAYNEQSTNMTVSYFYVPFFTIADSLVEVSESELADYLEAHREEYQREESRGIDYIVFPIVPSAEDSAFVDQEIKALQTGLKNAQNDSTYAAINSDGLNPFQVYNDPSLLPEPLVGQPVGTVTEPVIVGNSYEFYKLSAFTEGEESFANASHILIQANETNKEQAKARAEDIIKQLQGGADFATMAAVNSMDQSNSQNGGKLGWFGENSSMAQPFKDAVFDYGKEGLIPYPVETSYGFHIVKINEPMTNQVIKVAKIEKDFFASDETQNEIYRNADLLSANSSSPEEFKENVEKAGYTLKSAKGLGKNATNIGTIEDARSVVLWLYNDASLGDVSEVFELNNNYMVAAMSSKQEEGTAALSAVRNEVEGKVRNDKKGDFIINKLDAIQAEDFEAIKEAYGTEARVGESDLTLSSNSFPNIGFSPEAVGVAFSLDEGEKTRPFAIPNGVLMISALTKSYPEEISDYSTYILQVKTERGAEKELIANFPLTFTPVIISERLNTAVTKFADIEDKRYKFF